MELVALGTAGSFARHGQACSGYLFRAGGRSVLVDLGSGEVRGEEALAAPAEITCS